MKKYLKTFKSFEIFDEISEQDIVSALGCLNAVIRSYDSGSIIVHAGDRLEALGIIISGRVNLVRDDYFGNRVIIADLSQGDIFGETVASLDDEFSHVSVISTTQCEILFLDFKRIISTCHSACPHHTKLISNMVSIMGKKNLYLNKRLDIISQRTIREKLLCYLNWQREQTDSPDFVIPLNRNELSDYLCVDRSAMSRELSKMRREGLLDFDGNHFKLFTN